MNKISACVAVRNEEKVIKRCLESIRDVVDEIIIAHDGECSDNTIEICKKYTDKIFIRQFLGYAEPYRIFCLQKAEGPWILQIDADEFLSEGLKRELKSLTLKNDFDGYKFLWPVWDGRVYLTKYWPYKLCFYKKDKVSYLANIHSVPEVNGHIGKIKLILEHRPLYNNFSWDVIKKKWLKWARIHAQVYLKDFKKVEKFNYNKNDWPVKVKLRIKFPILLIPFEFLLTFFKSLLSGGYKEIFGYKYSFMYSIYRVMVNYYIFLEKHKIK